MTSSADTKRKNKNIAIYLAIFLGWFGAHKFYLNHYKTGVIYLLFFWTGIPLIISLFDAMILFSSENIVFNERYNGVSRDPRSIGMPNYAAEFIADNIPQDEQIIEWVRGRPKDTVSLEVLLIVTSRQVMLYGKRGHKEVMETLSMKNITSIDRKVTAGCSEIWIVSGLSSIVFRVFGGKAKSDIQKMYDAIQAAQLQL